MDAGRAKYPQFAYRFDVSRRSPSVLNKRARPAKLPHYSRETVAIGAQQSTMGAYCRKTRGCMKRNRKFKQKLKDRQAKPTGVAEGEFVVTKFMSGAVAVAALVSSTVVWAETTATPQNVAFAPDPLAHLAGRWVGDAVMTTDSGPSNFKCIVTYLPRKDAPGMQQNLRCDDGASFKLHAATDLAVEGGKVTGHWQDKINEIDGTVAGNVTQTGFEVQLSGRFFQARMEVAGQGCDQLVRVMPQKSEMFRELAATLKKC
jgi:hypothetical protein